MTGQHITIAISILTVASAAMNVYVGLRPRGSSVEDEGRIDRAGTTLMKQFVAWKDDLLQLLNGRSPPAWSRRSGRAPQTTSNGSTRCWNISSAGPAGCIFHQG